MKDESKINRLICKLQNFAKKDESIKTQQLPVSINHSDGVCGWWIEEGQRERGRARVRESEGEGERG